MGRQGPVGRMPAMADLPRVGRDLTPQASLRDSTVMKKAAGDLRNATAAPVVGTW
ncbi:hypothetical protein P3T35_001384 [Kitasatospora sp. GP30]|nr:hypothetical protein [Kitasatospora sp. GP30]